MRITVDTASDQPLHCAIEGELDVTTVEHAEQELERYLESSVAHGQQVQIDLSGLRLIDSCGVGWLVSLTLKVRAQGGEVTLEGLLGQPLAIVELLQLERDLTVQRKITNPWGWAAATPASPLTAIS
jgi:anti-sigma B factor antagonist